MRAWGFFLGLLLLLGGCVTTQEEFQGLQLRLSAVETQLATQEKRLAELEKSWRSTHQRLVALEKRLSAMEKATGALSERRVELLSELEKVRAELARLSGLYEELAYQQRQDREAFSEFQTEILKRLARQSTPSKSAPPKTSPSGEELYQEALTAFKKKDYERARKLLRTYLQEHPKGKYAPNAYFWIGETYYAERRYEEAILEYQKVIDRYPGSYKVPAALLKQGLAFLRLGDTEAAKILFKKILAKYPKSEQAVTARKYLKRLK